MTYTSEYPPAHNSTYVKATNEYSANYRAYFATDPAKSLTGSWSDNQWLPGEGFTTNQRFHIDLGIAKCIRRIYYQNSHNLGGTVNSGIQNFTFFGSNDSAAFNDLTYANDTNWHQLTLQQGTLTIHASSDVSDPGYNVVTNIKKYRYYALKFADNYGYANFMGLRRVELQTEDGFIVPSGAFFSFM